MMVKDNVRSDSYEYAISVSRSVLAKILIFSAHFPFTFIIWRGYYSVSSTIIGILHLNDGQAEVDTCVFLYVVNPNTNLFPP